MIERIIKFNEINSNNRIYLKENSKIPKETFVYLNRESVGEISKIIGTAKTKIKHNEVFLDIKFINTKYGKVAKSLYENGFKFVAAGIGYINTFNIVEQYELIGSFITNEPVFFGIYKRILLTEKIIFKHYDK